MLLSTLIFRFIGKKGYQLFTKITMLLLGLLWMISYIIHNMCMHKIQMETDAKRIVDHQRRLNTKMKVIVRIEILKLFEAGIVYSISDSI